MFTYDDKTSAGVGIDIPVRFGQSLYSGTLCGVKRRQFQLYISRSETMSFKSPITNHNSKLTSKYELIK